MPGYSPSPGSDAHLSQVKRFSEQLGCLGLSSESLYQITTAAMSGEDTRQMNAHHPYDYDDFIRIGLLVLAKPELFPYLDAMRGKSSGRWTGIIENWDELIEQFFYSTKMNNRSLNGLLDRCMNEGIQSQCNDAEFLKTRADEEISQARSSFHGTGAYLNIVLDKLFSAEKSIPFDIYQCQISFSGGNVLYSKIYRPGDKHFTMINNHDLGTMTIISQ